MSWFFFLCLVVSLILLIVGLIKPSALKPLFKKTIARKGVILYLGLAVFLSFIAFAITAPTPKDKIKTEADVTAKTQESTSKPSSVTSPSPASKAEQTRPKIEFSGKVDPSFAQKGDKVIITVEVSNLDKEQSIEGVRILFADEAFVKKGLVIVNVMSGGVQQGRAFEWKNDLMRIAPGEKRTFTIVGSANEAGNYESVITLTNPTGTKQFDDQGQELKAKLNVI